jgi:sensor histidine kinase YesM
LEFTAVNTVSSYKNSESLVQHGGIGLENIKKRLDLLYKGQHQLIIESNDNEFKVRLIIPT